MKPRQALVSTVMSLVLRKNQRILSKMGDHQLLNKDSVEWIQSKFAP